MTMLPRLHRALPCALISWLAATPAASELLHVPGDHPTVQQAIDAAGTGDHVVVAIGTYPEPGVDLLGKAITLRSSDPGDAAVVRGTVLSAAGGDQVVRMVSGESATLAGLTLTGAVDGGVLCGAATNALIRRCLIRGNAAENGAGLRCEPGASATVVECAITGNSATFQGGGMRLEEAALTLSRSILSHNAAGRGAALWCIESELVAGDLRVDQNAASVRGGAFRCVDSDVVIERSRFAGNSAVRNGGALRFSGTEAELTACLFTGNWALEDGGAVFSYLTPLFRNCILADNWASDRGGAVFASYTSHLTLRNCTLVGNRAAQGAAVYGVTRSETRLTNCVIWDHEGPLFSGVAPIVSHSDVEGGWPGTGNLDAEPRLRDWAGYTQALGQGSACIDAGEGAVDALDWGLIDGRYDNGLAPDMGAYGGPNADQWLDFQVPE